MKVVIIGGVAGGATAAAHLHRLNEDAETAMLEHSGYFLMPTAAFLIIRAASLRNRTR